MKLVLILGTQGVGKSMILNLIAHDKPFDDVCSQILKSHEIPSEPATEDDASTLEQMDNLSIIDDKDSKKYDESTYPYFKFKMQDMDEIERGIHCTKGI